MRLLSRIIILIFCLGYLWPWPSRASQLAFPNGILLRARNDAKVFYVENGQKRPIESPNMLRSQFRWEDVVVSTPIEVNSLPMGPEMTYRDGSLLSNRGTVYVISDGKRRPIESAQTFLQKGYKWSNVIAVSDAELAPHPAGEALRAADNHPNGTLLLAPNGEVYVLRSGQRRYIPSPLIFEARYRWEFLIPVSQSYLNGYSKAENEFYPDGLLISSATGVYIMQSNSRKPIPSPEVFESYGLNWSQVRRATDFELSIIPVSTGFDGVKRYQQGSLLRSDTGQVYQVNAANHLQYIVGPRLFNNRGLDWGAVLPLPRRVLDRYPQSARLGFADGSLISFGGGVYLVENGLKRGVPSPSVFLARGYSWNNVMPVSQEEFETNPMGASLSDIQAATLNGYTIPATSGRTAREQHLPLSCTENHLEHYGRANTPESAWNGLLTSGGAFSIRCPDGSRNSSYAPFSLEEEKYYITMRWNYVRWFEATSTLTQNISATADRIPTLTAVDYPNAGWVIINGEIIAYNGKDGNNLIVSQRGVDSPTIAASPRSHNSGSTVQEVYEYRSDIWRGRTRSSNFNSTSYNWHRGRKVLVINPANGRRLVASILESGPAIFTGRVSGLSPEAMLALGAVTDTNLEYGFLLDQSIPVGPLP